MGFLYDRQRQMVQQFYTEIGALEEVMEEAAFVLGDEAYTVLNQARPPHNVSLQADQQRSGHHNPTLAWSNVHHGCPG